MALFRIFKGNKNKLGVAPSAGEQDTRYAHEGFAYFTPDDGKFYIDIAGNAGDTNTPAVIGTNRIPLSANRADKDRLDRLIDETYAKRSNSVYYVLGDGSGSAGNWTGTIDSEVTELYDGLTIIFCPQKAGVSNSTNRTLTNDDSTTVSLRHTCLKLLGVWKPVYYQQYNASNQTDNRLTTHYGANAMITMTYRTAANGGTGGWVAGADYNSDQPNYRQLDLYFRPYASTDPIYRYKICALDKDNRLVPLTITNQTSGTNIDKTQTALSFKPDQFWLYYSTTTTAAGAVVPAQILYRMFGDWTSPQYTFNTTIPAYTLTYLKGSFDSSTNLFTLDQVSHTSWQVNVPTNTANLTLSNYFTTDSYYILMGGSYSSNNYFCFFENNPMYYFDGTNLIPIVCTAERAKKDSLGNNIVNTYLTKASGVTNVAWDNTNKKLTKTINGSTTDVVAVTVNNPTLAWNTESTIAKIGTVDVKVKLPANPNTNTATAADNILDGSNSGTQITYAPYSTQQSQLSFDTSTTAPTGTDRLNLNGYLYATKLYSGGTEVKVKQTAINSATAETTTATTFVYSVTQDTNGVITVKTRPLPTYNNYSLPLAASGTRGGIQIGYTQSGKNYPVQLSNEKAYVNVPWTDRYVNTAAFADDSANTAASPIKMTLTRAGSDTATVTANIPKVSSSSAGVAPKGAAVSSQSQTTKFLREDGTWAVPSYTTNTNTTYTLSGALSSNTFVTTLTPSSGSATTATVPAMTAATASAAGAAGLVPAPAAGNNVQFLRGDGTWANPKEAYIEWGGRNFSASYGCIDAAMVDELGANRLMFLNPAGITIEYTRDGGTTWTDYGATDVQKRGLFAAGQGFSIGKADSTNKATEHGTDYQLRVTIDTGAAGVYTALNKFVIYLSTNGSAGSNVTIQKALQSSPETYIDVAANIPVSGWSGYNVINVSAFTTYGNTASSQYGRIRFIFRANGGSSSYAGMSVSKIMGFGGVGWTTPSTMAKTGHLYAYDNSQNATFPANVTATKFIGPLQGNADTATKATQDGSGNVITSTYVKKAGDTMTGRLNLQANQYTDSYSGALNLNNSNIYGVNSIYTADLSDNSQEGFHFYRDATHVDTFYIKSGVPYFVANRELGTNGTSVPIARISGTITSGKVVVTDGTTGAVKAGTTSTATVIKTITFTAGEAPTLGDAISADDITAWSAGTTPTLGDAISADDITAWSAGTLPTLGTAIPADDITAWNAGTSPSLTITTVNADDITAWDAGSVTTAAVENGVLTITTGTASSLSYTARSIGSASGWSAGTKPSLSYTAKSIPNVTGVGSLPSLSYTARTIPNVTSVGTAPSLTYTARSIPNITSVGSVPTLTTTTQNVITGIS